MFKLYLIYIFGAIILTACQSSTPPLPTATKPPADLVQPCPNLPSGAQQKPCGLGHPRPPVFGAKPRAACGGIFYGGICGVHAVSDRRAREQSLLHCAQGVMRAARLAPPARGASVCCRPRSCAGGSTPCQRGSSRPPSPRASASLPRCASSCCPRCSR